MDAKERWQALQTHLTRAQERFDAGDRAAALEAVNSALALDPNFLAAHALRDRVLSATATLAASPAKANPGAPSIGADAVRPLVSAEGYAQFEQRARRRRVDRRVDAARSAIAAGRFREAASAIDEIRELDPNLPELSELTAAWASLGPQSRAARPGRWLAAAAAFVVVMLGASWLQESGGIGPRSLESMTDLVVPRAPLASTPSSAAATEPLSAAEPVAAAEPVSAPPAVPDEPAGTTGEINESPEPEAARDAEPPREPRPAAVPASMRSSASPTFTPEPIAAVAAPVNPPPQAPASAVGVGTPPLPPVQVSAPPAASPVSAASAVPTRLPVPDDEALVKQTLQRYRIAYEGLDAGSARAVWPAVNEAALARAFDGLASQKLTFDACDVTLRGEAAAAVCRGSARYVPKIGSREPRIEPRTWNFTLRKADAGWTIESARTER